MFRLVIQDDEGKTTVVPLIRDEITIGRKEGNTIRLTERNVSRRHARIIRQNNEVQIEDLGSYNGIRVNNARIAERVSLRISDQVQIGDYKLYLKAEGVEQVDDARTMPIERIDNPLGGSTDIMPVQQGTPTQPLQPAAIAAAAAANGTATPPPGAATSGLAGAQLVGNPARTMVAIADTDPAGRPVANAAAVAALTHVAGYGKLVALSSNFAKQEWELSRPQMIIGRTDENDIVINHRSISRNHAKLVREPETGRYTISDLQSSNGVRVNGQDYGKVELRRGDVVDLGHVRLRFVEPGEDFIFDRDAQITDVPDGNKKGLWIALVFGAIVVIGIIVFVMTRGGNEKKPTDDNGSSGQISSKGSGLVANVTPDADQGGATVPPGSDTNPANNGGGGSGSAEQNTTPVDAPSQATTNPPPANDDKFNQCLELQKQRKWVPDLQDCATALAATRPADAKRFQTKATAEFKASENLDKLKDAIANQSLTKAADAAGSIPSSSDYYKDAQALYQPFEKKVTAEAVQRGKDAAAAGKCKDLAKMIEQAQSGVISRALKNITCDDGSHVAVKQGSGTPPGPGSNPPPPPQNACSAADIDNYKAKATTDLSAGQDASALRGFEKAYACRADSALLPRMVLSACKSSNAAKAKQYYKQCGGACSTLVARCQTNNINLP